MSVIAFDFYSEDDPNGTPLGTLDDADCKAMEFRVGLHEMGSGLFTVSRHNATATATLIRENNLVKVRIPSVSENPIFAFWLKDGNFSLLSSEEQGGEDMTFGGPGVIYILALARLYHSSLVSDQPSRGSLDVPGMWTWENEPYGAILTRIIEEGRESPFPDAAAAGSALEHVTITFDRVNDSGSVAWPNITATYEERIGTDMLTVAERLREAGGLFYIMQPDLQFDALQSYGRDLTGAFASDTVRFEKGVNILTELNRDIGARALGTHLLQMDADGNYSTEVLAGWTSATRKHWLYNEASQTNDDTLLNAIGADTLRRSNTQVEALKLEWTPGFDPANGAYMPGPTGTSGHVWVGDSVTLHTGTGEHDYNAASQVVTALRVVLDSASDDSTDDTAARSLHCVAELNYEDVRSARWDDSAPGGGPSTHNHPPNPELCRPGIPGGEPTIAAQWHFDSGADDDDGNGWTFSGGGYGGGWNSGGFMRNGALASGNIGIVATADCPTVTAGLTYDFSALVQLRGDSSFVPLTFRAQWLNGSGGTISSISSTTSVMSAWTPVGMSGTAPVGAVRVRLDFLRTSATTNTDVDDVIVSVGSATAAVINDGHPDLVGDSLRAARCDHRHDVHRDRSPTVTDDWATAGYKLGTIWAQLDDLENPTAILGVWMLVDTTEGAAVWAEWPGGGDQSAADVTYDNTTSGLTAVEVQSALDEVAARRATLLVVIDGGGSAITTGIKGDVTLDFACVIEAVTMLADQSGSIVVDIWKDTYANYPPVVGDSITASAKPTISTAVKSQDSTLTGWTTTIAAGDTLRFNVDSATTIQRVTLALKVRKT